MADLAMASERVASSESVGSLGFVLALCFSTASCALYVKNVLGSPLPNACISRSEAFCDAGFSEDCDLSDAELDDGCVVAGSEGYIRWYISTSFLWRSVSIWFTIVLMVLAWSTSLEYEVSMPPTPVATAERTVLASSPATAVPAALRPRTSASLTKSKADVPAT